MCTHLCPIYSILTKWSMQRVGELLANIAKKIPARPEISAIPYQRTVAKIYNPLNKSRNSYIYI